MRRSDAPRLRGWILKVVPWKLASAGRMGLVGSWHPTSHQAPSIVHATSAVTADGARESASQHLSAVLTCDRCGHGCCRIGERPRAVSPYYSAGLRRRCGMEFAVRAHPKGTIPPLFLKPDRQLSLVQRCCMLNCFAADAFCWPGLVEARSA